MSDAEIEGLLALARDTCAATNASDAPFSLVLPLSSYMWIKYGPARGRWQRVTRFATAMRAVLPAGK